MALKAGYYGIKKAFKDTIESLIANMSDMLIIKSLDDALSLSDDGELSVDDASTSGKGIVQLDTEPTEGSGNAITSGAVFAALQDVGSFVKETLYTSSAYTADVVLSKNVDDFDFIIVNVYSSITNNTQYYIIPALEFMALCPYVESPVSNVTPHYLAAMYYNTYTRMIMGDADNKLKLYDTAGDVYVKNVYGIKF